MRARFLPGIDGLLARHGEWLAGRRVGLVSHVAAVDARGVLAAQRLWQAPGSRLTCLFGPEHGFLGTRGAGAHCDHERHPHWRIPVYSLYGATRKPSPAMLKSVDVLVFDMQDLAARCYTFVSTLQYVLAAAAECGKPVIVADRPVPLPRVIDGPMREPAFESFVSLVDVPLSYGMTPGEVARLIVARQGLSVDLRVARMQGYRRDDRRGHDWPPWLPPSPAIVSWESAACFPMTVCFEGLGAVDHGRRTGVPFQVVGAPWSRSEPLAEALNDLRLPGVQFHPHRYDSTPRLDEAHVLDGVRCVVTDPRAFRPVLTGVSIVAVLQALYGRRRVWARATARPDFFDKLLGTDEVRLALLDGEDGRTIAARWQGGLRRFATVRKKHLLYAADGRA